MVNSLLIENIIEIYQCDEVRKIVSTIKKFSYQNSSIRLKIKDLMKHNWNTKFSKEGTVGVTERIWVFQILVVHL